MSTPLIVYSVINGVIKDKLRPVIAPPDPDGRRVRYVCFSDTLNEGESRELGWEVLTPLWRHEDDCRRTSRWHKLNSHLCFPDTPYTLWADGTHQLKVNPWQLVDAYLSAANLSTFRHDVRDCVYQELEACVKLKKDSEPLMREQVARYNRLGWPAHAGLYENCVLLRRDTAETRRFNAAWWEELKNGSYRDQLSMPFIASKLGFPVAVMPGCRVQSEFFQFFKHR